MVLHRYPLTPAVRDYKVTIREVIEAHFFGLDHVAAGGLILVIEGTGRRLAQERKIKNGFVKDVFSELALASKRESAQQNMGNPDEVAAMMDSFGDFMRDSFFANSRLYQFEDGTNRNGIAHGAFANDYGRLINFYKTIAAVDFLTFVSSFQSGNISWLAPDPTAESQRLQSYFEALRTTRSGMLRLIASSARQS